VAANLKPRLPTNTTCRKALFENTTKLFHIPSAEAKGAEKLRLQTDAVAGYEKLLNAYPDQDYWAAQALRSLGNIYASQTNLNAAVKEYALVEKALPEAGVGSVDGLESAADLLWQDNRKDDARQFYTNRPTLRHSGSRPGHQNRRAWLRLRLEGVNLADER